LRIKQQEDAGVDMTKSTSRKKRNKLTVILLAPILAIVFIAGWSLYWIGQSWHQNTKQPQKPTYKTPTKQDEVELIMIPQEEQILAN
jgi:flagellar basal body-associated protein FliL